MSEQEKDPVVHSSLSKPLFISSALLLLSALIFVLGLSAAFRGRRQDRVEAEDDRPVNDNRALRNHDGTCDDNRCC